MVSPMSKGFDWIHFPYYLTISFKSSLDGFPLINPFRRLRVNSPSSVIYPGATLCGPPPGIIIDFATDTWLITYYENSKYVPIASPNKAPIMQPYAKSRDDCSIASFNSSN